MATSANQCIFVTEEGYNKDHFVIPPHYKDHLDRVLIPHGLIVDRIEKLAYDIATHYGNTPFNIICVLKGSRSFFTALLSSLSKIYLYSSTPRTHTPFFEHYVRLSSYINTSSTGKLNVIAEDLSALKGQHILILEDIVDTGFTLSCFCDWLKDKVKPCNIAIASLLDKRVKRTHDITVDFVGFSIPPVFIVGFSLDYNEHYRDMDHVCVLNPETTAMLST